MFADILKNLRVERALTQQNVADSLKISRSVLSNYEAGKVEPTLTVLSKLSDFFEVSVDYLLGREDDFGNITIQSSASVAPSLSEKEKTLITSFRALSPGTQDMILHVLETSREMEAKKKA